MPAVGCAATCGPDEYVPLRGREDEHGTFRITGIAYQNCAPSQRDLDTVASAIGAGSRFVPLEHQLAVAHSRCPFPGRKTQ